MNDHETSNGAVDDITPQVRTMQIIAGALIVGTVTFGAIMVALGWGKQPDPNQMMLVYVAFVFSAVDLGAWAVVPNIIARTAITEEMAAKPRFAFAAIYRTKLIVSMALLQGVAFFNLIVYMLSHYWYPLAITGGLLLLMLLSFPTRTRIEHWIENRRQDLSM